MKKNKSILYWLRWPLIICIIETMIVTYMNTLEIGDKFHVVYTVQYIAMLLNLVIFYVAGRTEKKKEEQKKK